MPISAQQHAFHMAKLLVTHSRHELVEYWNREVISQELWDSICTSNLFRCKFGLVEFQDVAVAKFQSYFSLDSRGKELEKEFRWMVF